MSLETFKLAGNPFEGANIQTFKDATGAVFFIYSGTNPNDPTFKQQVARLKNGKYTWYSVPNPNHPRPTGTLEVDGLYVTYFSDESGTVRRWKVPDYVMPASGGSPGETPDPSPADPSPVDPDYAALKAEVQQLKTAVNRQAQQITELRNIVQSNRPGGLTWLQIKDHLWNDNIIQDKVYLDLQQKGGIYGMIEAIVRALK